MDISRRFKSHHDALATYSEYSVSKRMQKDELFAELKTKELDYSRSHAMYIHTPYCDKICSFCNLNRSVKDDNVLNYHLKVIEQLKEYASLDNVTKLSIGSIYFGGGTPTVLEGEQIRAIVKTIKELFNVETDCEISVESTLHNLDLNKLAIMQEGGINRLSIGIQTFDSQGRKYFNRTFNKNEVVNKLKEIRNNFKGIVTIDKIYNYHLETKEMLEEDVKLIQETDVDSISFYSLMIHKGSSLSHNPNYKTLDDTNDLEFHNYFVEKMMETNNYDILELTKLVKKNRDKYRYITIRNNGGYTIPVGQGSGGNIANYKMMNMNFDMMMIIKEENEQMQKADLLYGMMQFNKFNLDNISQHLHIGEIHFLKSKLQQLVLDGYLTKEDNNYIHTQKGLFYGNNVCAEIVKQYLDAFNTLKTKQAIQAHGHPAHIAR
ncbi:radical SAM protein [Mycoplasma sp. P36-A1]|uniref:radical SAM protein n=1 Tax=Mycoplasma sp. P36-A1 TaxID=3252900 RepID=UPI003C2AC6BC